MVALYMDVYIGDPAIPNKDSLVIIKEKIFPTSSAGTIFDTKDLTIGLSNPPKLLTIDAAKLLVFFCVFS